ncbi:MAG TPA: molybdopterin-dependent oxidoreductase [Ramlibacter sp.]|nr:molybdopterin-dependent oxidoreductase [Ramlibacter sp.]
MAIQRFPHSSHWGAYTILVEDGRICGIEPFAGDPAPSPINESVRAWADPTRRVLQPMVRASWLRTRGPSARGGSGEFIPIGWDDVLKLVADEIQRVRTEHGNSSIFAGSYGWTSCGRFHHASSQLKRFLNLVGGYTGHVDTYSIAAGPVILRHTLGSSDACEGRGSTLDTIAEHTETLVVFGALTPRTAQIEAGGLARHTLEDHLRRLVARDVKIILVSPVRDDLPDWVPADWWPIRPNTDTALMLGLAGEIVNSGRHDQDFLRRCCSGSDQFLSYLRGEAAGSRKDAAWAAGITALDAGKIRRLAGHVVDTRTMLTVSWSLQRADHGEQPFWAALALAAVIGQIGLPGAGVGYGYGSLGGVGAAQPTSKSPAFPQLRKPNPDFIPVARISDLLLKPGTPFTYQGRTQTYPTIKLVYWAGGNPFHHHQDLNRLRQAWAQPETIIVQEPLWTATARRADIVLPATTSIERNDIAGNRRSDHLVAMHKAIEPLGQAWNDYDILRALAERFGVGGQFSENRSEMAWIQHLYEVSSADAARLGHPLPDFEAFWRRGFVDVPVQENVTYLEAYRRDPAAVPLDTETGRILLWSESLERLDLRDCAAHPAWLEPAEWLGAPGADERGFHLISQQPPDKLHSQLDFAPLGLKHKRNGLNVVRMNPQDAQRLGIQDGANVRLWNARGQCRAAVAIDDAVRANVLVFPTGAWYEPQDEGENPLELNGNANVLTLDKGSSGFGQGCSAHTCIVHIDPV